MEWRVRCTGYEQIGGATGHTAYTVVTQARGSTFESQHRFSDFLELHAGQLIRRGEHV